MINVNLDEVKEATDFEQLPAGGYVCIVKGVKDFPDKQYIKIEFDVAEGDNKNFFLDACERSGYWFGNFIKSYKAAALPFFKAFVTAVESSNNGYKWDNDEAKLVDKLIGLTIGEEEYRNNEGKVKTRIFVDRVRSVEAIRKGDFIVPEMKKLPPAEPGGNLDNFMPGMTPTNEPSPWG